MSTEKVQSGPSRKREEKSPAVECLQNLKYIHAYTYISIVWVIVFTNQPHIFYFCKTKWRGTYYKNTAIFTISQELSRCISTLQSSLPFQGNKSKSSEINVITSHVMLHINHVSVPIFSSELGWWWSHFFAIRLRFLHKNSQIQSNLLGFSSWAFRL